MSGPFCGNCGAQHAPGARFCASCGTPTAEQPAESSTQVLPTAPLPPAAPAPPAEPPAPAAGPAAPGGATPPTSTTPPPGYGAPGGYPPPPYAGPAGGSPQPAYAPPAEHNPFAGASPFAATPGGRSPMDALLGGDWAGAAIASGICLGVMTVIALLSAVLLEVYETGARPMISFVLIAVAAALGGNIGVSADEDEGDFSSSLGLLPLMLTFAGLTALALTFRARLRRKGLNAARDAWFQVLRTALVLAAMTLVVALVSRYKAKESDSFDFEDLEEAFVFPGLTLFAGVLSSVFGALLFAVAALAITIWIAFPQVLPAPLQRLRSQTVPSLGASLGVAIVGLLAALGGLVYTLATEDDKAAQVGTALLLLPNFALGIVLLAMGVPLNVEADSDGDSEEETVNLFTFTDENALYWLAPVVLALTLVAAATVVVLRQHTVLDGRKEGFRFAGVLALCAFLGTLLVRIAGDIGGIAFAEDLNGEATVAFNPVVAAFVAGLWGLAAGLLAPALAGLLPPGAVGSLRRRFGTAPVPPGVAGGHQQPPPGYAPPPAGYAPPSAGYSPPPAGPGQPGGYPPPPPGTPPYGQQPPA